MRTELVGQFGLANGETAWLVEHQEPLSEGVKEQIIQNRALLVEMMRDHWDDVDVAKVDPRAVVFGYYDDGTRMCLDMAVPLTDITRGTDLT